MRKFILGLIVTSMMFGGYFSDNFLKYSTFYASVSLESPFTPKQKFAVDTQEGTFKDILMSPISRVEIAISYLIAILIIGIIVAIINLIIINLFVEIQLFNLL